MNCPARGTPGLTGTARAAPPMTLRRAVHSVHSNLIRECLPLFPGLQDSAFPELRILQQKRQPVQMPTRPNYQQRCSLHNRNPQSEDGLLRVYKIFNVKLNADLVVLSACKLAWEKMLRAKDWSG